MSLADPDTPIEQAIAAVARIGSVPSLLKVLCETTGMGFAAVARVTDHGWTACAVQDSLAFGLQPGGALDVETTLCKEVRASQQPIAFDQASQDPRYCSHQTPKMYGFESYVSVPIVLADGGYFGNLCALDPKPAEVENERILALFGHFAQLIAFELDNIGRLEDIKRELFDAKNSGARREQFIAVLGHDLRNPLASISACARLLSGRQTDPAVLQLADRIGRNAGRMGRLIEDLLDYARGQLGGGLTLATAPIDDMAAVIGDAVDELRTAHPDRTIRLALAIDRPVVGDRGRIQQLVSNLVANALVHGAADAPVDVEASIDGDALVITVRNAGEPIPEEAIAGLFDAFARHGPRADTAAKANDGLGLGLFICRQIAQAHGGTLRATSSREAGTVFEARLPLAGAG